MFQHGSARMSQQTYACTGQHKDDTNTIVAVAHTRPQSRKPRTAPWSEVAPCWSKLPAEHTHLHHVGNHAQSNRPYNFRTATDSIKSPAYVAKMWNVAYINLLSTVPAYLSIFCAEYQRHHDQVLHFFSCCARCVAFFRGPCCWCFAILNLVDGRRSEPLFGAS